MIPMKPSPDDVTELLIAWEHGDQAALDRLMPLVYEELRRRARQYMNAQGPGHTLQTTALIHEAFLKLVNQPHKHWANRTHFTAVAARAMRQILIDHARAHACAKRGGPARLMSLDDGAVISVERAFELVALDDALKALEKVDPRKARVVEMRYFGGLSVDEASQVLGVSPDTVMRDWRLAKSWLRRELTGTGSDAT
jgi:RNA polymerase sigma-70 factor (ECF subfamily)